ncbi:MAG: hypothetical protein JXX29_11955 [Deltaproteobacteria bacterium]|nr:hypothetical protein [Deltaproteobacteria bacterium]MBN2672388.1 hypothetical protein [Deltaproteobacteria bacterium]
MKFLIKSMRLFRLFAMCCLTALCVACAVESHDPAAMSDGSVWLPLYARGSLNSEFRLTDGEFVVSEDGVELIRVNTNDYLSESAIVLDLPVGTYEVLLEDGWKLERLDEDWVAVEAELISENPLSVDILDDQTTVALFSFRAGNEIVNEDGSLEIGIEIIEEAPACDDGLTLCGEDCVDVLWTNTHCGACGSVCASGGWCSNGGCVCAEDFITCDNTCVNQHWDNQNCGECGNICSTWCNNGTCQ